MVDMTHALTVVSLVLVASCAAAAEHAIDSMGVSHLDDRTCGEPVDCDRELLPSSFDDPIGKSLWGVANKTDPPDPEILRRCLTRLEIARCRHPENWEVNFYLGMVYSELGLHRCAASSFDLAYEFADTPNHQTRVVDSRRRYWVDHRDQALGLYDGEEYVAALSHARLCVIIDTADCEGHDVIGACCIALEEYEQAVAALLLGLEACPEHPSLEQRLRIARERIVLDQGSGGSN